MGRGINLMELIMSAPEDDVRLARLAQAGELAAFDRIARQYQVILLRFVRRNFPNIPDAEDIVQESLLRAFENIGKYRPAWPLKSWLLTITCRVAVNQIRHHSVQSRLMANLRHRCVTASAGPRDSTADHDESLNLWNAAARLLTPTQFRAVWLLYAEEMDRHDIARILGKSRPTTRLILYRAKKILQSHFSASAAESINNSADSRVAQGVVL